MAFKPRLFVTALLESDLGGSPRLDVELAFGDGITALLGPSGAGKSSLLAVVAGLLASRSGRGVLDGTVLTDTERGVRVPAHQRRVALVFQSLALFPHMSALENVAYGIPVATARTSKERRQVAHGWLARAHVVHVEKRRPSTLSGGEAQRVALARALASEPRALLLDEPFSAMDASLRLELGSELKALVDELSVPTVFVTHDLADAAAFATRSIHLDAGRVRAEG
jgi:molybdate transport system ATP-binding protein